jgi:transposase-like protein
MNSIKNLYIRHCFPPEVISHAAWLYHRFTLSFRDIEELLAIRGIHTSILLIGVALVLLLVRLLILLRCIP